VKAAVLTVTAVAAGVAGSLVEYYRPGGTRYMQRAYHQLALSIAEAQACHWSRRGRRHESSQGAVS